MGGLHIASATLNLKGPWERPLPQRKLIRQRALSRLAPGADPSTSHSWEQTLIACWELSDESNDPHILPSYSEIAKEGLPHLALALRNNTGPPQRLNPGAGLHPRTCTGLRFAAEQLGKRLGNDGGDEDCGGMRVGAGRVRVGKGAREYGWRSVEDAREAMGEVTH